MLRQQNPSDVDVAITPEELEGLDEASIQALYNQRVAEERARNAREVCPSFGVYPLRTRAAFQVFAAAFACMQLVISPRLFPCLLQCEFGPLTSLHVELGG